MRLIFLKLLHTVRFLFSLIFHIKIQRYPPQGFFQKFCLKPDRNQNLGLKNELGTLAIAYKDRLCRIAYDLIADMLIENSETKIIIENKSNQSFEQELADDMIQIITVFSSRLYGMRSYKNRILNKL